MLGAAQARVNGYAPTAVYAPAGGCWVYVSAPLDDDGLDAGGEPVKNSPVRTRAPPPRFELWPAPFSLASPTPSRGIAARACTSSPDRPPQGFLTGSRCTRCTHSPPGLAAWDSAQTPAVIKEASSDNIAL